MRAGRGPSRPAAQPRTAREVLAWLEKRGTARNRAGMARFGIRSPKVFGVSMATMRPLVRGLKGDHHLALALWGTGWLEARVLAALVDDPAAVTAAQMDRWAADFDNWAVCDTTCYQLFDRTPHAPRKIVQWSRRREEFVRRAAFVLIAGLAVHDKPRPDREFAAWLPLMARQADDERDYVRKGINWALRQVGKRSRALNHEALAVARRLAAAEPAAARWIGRDAARELASAPVQARLARRG